MNVLPIVLYHKVPSDTTDTVVNPTHIDLAIITRKSPDSVQCSN